MPADTGTCSHCGCTKQLDISHLSFDSARQTIDKQIQQLHLSIRRLQEQRNELTPISRLPSELLILIFKHVNNPKAENGRNNRSYSNGSALTTLRWRQFCYVMQVCRHWRAITLAYPDFWSCIICDTPAIAEAMLHRSKEAPLYVRLSNSAFMQKAKPSLQSKIMDMSRLAELHVELETSHLNSLLSAATGNAANFLQSLYIHRPRNYPSASCSIPSIVFPATPLPRLRHLDVARCNLDWSALDFNKHAFNSLISLKLKNVSPPSKTLFYSFLSHAPELEALVIDAAFPSSPGCQGAIKDVRLPKLRSCTLQDIALVDCVDFQQRVTYPATKARLRFELSKEPIQPPSTSNASVDSTSLIDRLLISCGLSQDSSPKRTHRNLLLKVSTYGMAIALWDGPFTNPIYHTLDTNGDTPVEINFSRNTPLSALSIPGVERLAICDVVSSYSSKAWHGFLTKHYKISQIYISSSDLLPITTALSTPTRTKTGDKLCLPILSTVTLTNHCEGMINDERDNEFNGLLDCLIARCNYRVPVQTLNLVECYLLDDDDVALLNEIVVGVDWDGEYMGFSDDEDEDEDEHYCGICHEYHGSHDYDDDDDELGMYLGDYF